MSLTEFELIEQFFVQRFAHSLDLSGGFDDCAALQLPLGKLQVLSNDTSVESVHFPADMAPAQIGHRALAVALSDLAAMGASPWWFSLALTLPETNINWLDQFSLGMSRLAQRCGIQLIGGDTTRGPLNIGVQVAGLVPDNRGLLCRSGARPGDVIAVTGTFGDAAAGLAQWRTDSAEPFLRRSYSEPEPRLREGAMLLGFANACIDVSDGLIADAGHIARRSGVKIIIEADAVPLSDAIKQNFKPQQALEMALCGGDDYQLCFSCSADNLSLLKAQGLQCAVIGRVLKGSGVDVVDRNNIILPIAHRGYQHFV